MSIEDIEKNLDTIEAKATEVKPTPEAPDNSLIEKVITLVSEQVYRDTYVKSLPEVITEMKSASENMQRVAEALEKPEPPSDHATSSDVLELSKAVSEAIEKSKPEIPSSVTVNNPVKSLTVENMPEIPPVTPSITKGFAGVLEKLANLPELIAERIKALGTNVTVVNKQPIEVVLTHEGKRYKAGGGGGYVATSGGGSAIGLREGISTGQVTIAVTGTRVQLPSYSCKNGLLLTNNGSSTITVGGSSVTNTITGAGNGYILVAGATISAACDDSSDIYINGTAGGFVSFIVT